MSATPQRGKRYSDPRRAARPRPASVRGRRPAGRRRVAKLRRLLRPWVLMSVVTVLVGLGYLLYYTGLFAVREVRIDGLKALSAEEIRTAANVPEGTPLLQVDTAEVAARIGTVPRVFTVNVERSFPSSLVVTVDERTPVGVFNGAEGPQLVDGTGRAYATVPKPPDGLPVVKVRSAAPDDPAAKAAVDVLAAVPDKLKPEVLEVSAEVPGDVRLQLIGGREVRWGSTADSGRKAQVLEPLLGRPGKIFNISSPDLPTVV
ncbi:FtsQ-type POTRA domain-containing protein [Crossiella sp. CA-258035]|uniref:cell division protein FtsQ/DivIB n=1 Tax=Crossiella sp. CA-258035 TaxID=2981138 RepID=UPI0024BC276A|nr:FtsQ-type POTRA domain-containing protein [Crossiella sp. CA-258035]WHT21357.1 FtsQ-type POTRA domain-containing protein [Crossiella sp. CA-258035]